MIWLANIEVEQRDYPDTHKTYQTWRVVDASTLREVEAKIAKHFDDQSSEYAVSYRGSVLEAYPCII